MPTLLNTVTIIKHPNDPNNIITLPKRETPKRLLVMVGRRDYDTFDDSPNSPQGKDFWVEGFSRAQWDFLRTKAGAKWLLSSGHKISVNKVDVHAWLEGNCAQSDKIKEFMLQQLNLDSNKYYIMYWSTKSFEPVPTLHEIKK